VVQATASLQFGPTSWQRPAAHDVWQRGPHSKGSDPVHGVHVGSATMCAQRFASRSHESVVHTFWSAQTADVKQQRAIGVWTQP